MPQLRVKLIKPYHDLLPGHGGDLVSGYGVQTGPVWVAWDGWAKALMHRFEIEIIELSWDGVYTDQTA